jgi:multicomponent Na+:H+ antiporter subunit B
MRRTITIILLIVCITVPFIAFDVLPVIGDPQSAPNTHVSDYYIEHAIDECNSPNMVTAVIVDYRAFDTMFETTVMFLAGLSVVIILANRPKSRIPAPESLKRLRDRSGRPVYNTINKDVMISVIEPVILIYAMYVLFHGEISLGGGFQAGALIGMTYLLDVMVVGREKPVFNLPKEKSAAIAGLGPFIYALTGIATIIGGGLYLEYNKMPVPVHQAELHSIGITAVEIGVTIGVAGTIITILNALMERISFDDDSN